MPITRRRLLVGAAGALVTGTAAVGLVEAGALPGRARMNAFLGWDGGAGQVPAVTPGAVTAATFHSAARSGPVGYSIIRPPGTLRDLPVAVVLHGRGGDHRSATTELAYDRFLAAAVDAGVPPFAMVSVDGGDRYWHRRADGDDPATMVCTELLQTVESQGFDVSRIALTGWSMGGYGALLLAESQLQGRVAAVAAASPAVFNSFAEAATGAFDSPKDFAEHDVLANASRLAVTKVRIDCGIDDPFAGTSRRLLEAIRPAPAGGMSAGAHTDAFWTRVAPAQLAFLGAALAR